MAKLYVVIDSLDEWSTYYPSENVITVNDYLKLPIKDDKEGTQVINLCGSYKYQSKGYYCSLLAEAREHRVIPSVKSINDLSKKAIYGLELDDLEDQIRKADLESPLGVFQMPIYFGKTPYKSMEVLARRIFEVFSFPLLKVKFVRQKQWQIEQIRPMPLAGLSEEEENFFAAALDEFSKKLWRKPRAKRSYKFDLAILHNPDEKLPPSNKTAIKNFVRAGRRLGFDVDCVTRKDYIHLPEYDALFIRETTALNHHTYMFAKKAESQGMVVIDDPNSILKCTNKVYLSNLLEINKISSPQTRIVDKEDPHWVESLEVGLGYPLVLKIPDGAFSVGVVKISDRAELLKEAMRLFERTYLLIAQEFLYTDFDWRIGVLNKRPLFACKYFMSKGHWQILDHSKGSRSKSGGAQAVPLHQVPREVVKTAVRSASLIGDGLYGVDVKVVQDQTMVIEINDNPNIDAHVEDEFLGDDLYLKVMDDILRRLQHRGL